MTLAGCATTAGGGKPVLTQRAFDRMAAACGVRPVSYSRSRKHLPRVAFAYADAAKETETEPAPSVSCMGAHLQQFRYEFFGPRAEPARPEG